MGSFTKGILDALDRGLDNLLGNEDVVVVENPLSFLHTWWPTSQYLRCLGEVAMNPHVIQSFAQSTTDITANIATCYGFRMLPWPPLRPFLEPFNDIVHHGRTHRTCD